MLDMTPARWLGALAASAGAVAGVCLSDALPPGAAAGWLAGALALIWGVTLSYRAR